jgi:hypothetical protein
MTCHCKGMITCESNAPPNADLAVTQHAVSPSPCHRTSMRTMSDRGVGLGVEVFNMKSDSSRVATFPLAGPGRGDGGQGGVDGGYEF